MYASVCTSEEDETYSYDVSLVKGISEIDEAASVGVLLDKKIKILEIVHQTINEINVGLILDLHSKMHLLKIWD